MSWYSILKPNGKVLTTNKANTVITAARQGAIITRVLPPQEVCGCPRCEAELLRGGAK